MTYDTTPDPHFLLSIRSKEWSVHTAVCELVDNSIGHGRGNAKEVTVVWDESKRSKNISGDLWIFDNGRGMDAVGDLFKLGATAGRVKGDNGLYGAGGTEALLWLGRTVEVWTLRKGMVNCDRVDWLQMERERKYPRVSDRWIPAAGVALPPLLKAAGHGTAIHIRMGTDRKFKPEALGRSIEKAFSPAIRDGRTIRFAFAKRTRKLNVRTLEADEPATSKDMVRFSGRINLEGYPNLSYRGEAFLVDGLPVSKTGLTIGMPGGRVMRPDRPFRDCFRLSDGSKDYSGTGVTGHIDLLEGWQDFLSTDKGAIKDDFLRDHLMDRVFAKIEPLLERAQHDAEQIMLDDARLDLQRMFDGASRIDAPPGEHGDPLGVKEPETADVEPGSRPNPVVPGPGPAPAAGPLFPPAPSEKKPRSFKVPAGGRIQLDGKSDEAMEGKLCAVHVSPGAVYVSVNKKHPVVSSALTKNRPVLGVLVAHHLAEKLSADLAATRALLGNKIADLAFEKDAEDRVAFLNRRFVDSHYRSELRK